MTNSNPTWREVKTVVADWNEDQLRGLVQDLYRLNAGNAEFLHARLFVGSDAAQTLEPFKKRIKLAVSPSEPWKRGVRLSEGRKAISDFKKANGNISDLLALMVYYVQCGNDFTLEFGDIDEAFYDSLCSMVDQIKKLLIKENDVGLAAKFIPLLEKEFERIDGQMGWGYPDELGEQVAELKGRFTTTAAGKV
jgi:hypothetical protein